MEHIEELKVCQMGIEELKVGQMGIEELKVCQMGAGLYRGTQGVPDGGRVECRVMPSLNAQRLSISLYQNCPRVTLTLTTIIRAWVRLVERYQSSVTESRLGSSPAIITDRASSPIQP